MKKIIPLFLVVAMLACKNKDQNNNGNTGEQTPDGPKSISYSIINTYPHDTSSFTQGLVIYNGELYEGTGEYGRSKLLKVDLKTGKAEKQTALDKKYFGEGIAVLRDTVYQLTWKEKTVFVYTLKDFKKIKEYSINSDGWGITTDGKELIASDGGTNLYFYDPSTFHLLKTLEVTEAGSLVHNLNELEYIDGFVYANEWQYPYILKINPDNGQVIGKIDLSDLSDKIKAKDSHADYLNGIAYDAATKKIYITGKLWPDLYEIQFGQ